MSFKALPGVFDIVSRGASDPWRQAHLWQYVERVIRQTALDFGYDEIRTPIFERTELFQRSVGEETDIVSKEMYSFEDRGGRKVSLRPEGTAPVIRAFIENNLHNLGATHKLFYIGPMFRYERKQAGRFRQHHQFGAEAFGSSSPEQDVELIDLIYTVYTRLGLQGLQVTLNSLGDIESRGVYREALTSYLSSHNASLSKESQQRLITNPLRVLDSKEECDLPIISKAPVILDFLTVEEKAHFSKVQELLTQLEIPFIVNAHLVRGLDYYTRTVFEVVAEELGSQNSVGGGGRYDGLLKSLGGPDLPAMGFGTGIERIIQTLLNQNIPAPNPNAPTLYIIPLGDQATETCFSILHKLRLDGIPSQMDFSGRKLGKVMNHANQIGAHYVVVIGEDEIANNQVKLKEMSTGKSTTLPLAHLSTILRIEAKGEDLIKVWNETPREFQKSEEADFFFAKLTDTLAETKQQTDKLQNAIQTLQKWL